MLELMLYDFARSDGCDNTGNPSRCPVHHVLYICGQCRRCVQKKKKSYSTRYSIYFLFFLFVSCMVGVIAAHEVIQHQLQHYFWNIVFLFFLTSMVVVIAAREIIQHQCQHAGKAE